MAPCQLCARVVAEEVAFQDVDRLARPDLSEADAGCVRLVHHDQRLERARTEAAGLDDQSLQVAGPNLGAQAVERLTGARGTPTRGGANEEDRNAAGFQCLPALAGRSVSLVQRFHVSVALTACPSFEEQTAHQLGLHVRTHFAVDQHDGREGAASHARHAFQTELAVRSHLAGRDAEPLLEVVQDLMTAAHMAGCALADVNRMLGWRLKSEVSVEARQSVDLVFRHSGRGGEYPQRVFGQVTVALLDFLEARNQMLLAYPARAGAVSEASPGFGRLTRAFRFRSSKRPRHFHDSSLPAEPRAATSSCGP